MLWSCACDCGNNTEVWDTSLRSGATRSCGCLRDEKARENIKKAAANRPEKAHFIHGQAPAGRPTPEYRVWCDMRKRCRAPSATGFARYGGRGIRVCEAWDSFEVFFADMGRRPSPKHSIDRIDNDGNYEPENCRWATRKEQANNRHTNRLVTARGETHTLAQWADLRGIPATRVQGRLNAGETPEEALQFV